MGLVDKLKGVGKVLAGGAMLGYVGFFNAGRSNADIIHYADEIPASQQYANTLSTNGNARIYDLDGYLADGEIKAFFADDPFRTAIGVKEVINGILAPGQLVMFSSVPYAEGRPVDFEFWNSLTDEETPLLENILSYTDPSRVLEEFEGVFLFGDWHNYNSEMFQSEYFDSDHDGDLDLEDFSHFRSCFTGVNQPLSANCTINDVDTNGAVDLKDFYYFQDRFTE